MYSAQGIVRQMAPLLVVLTVVQIAAGQTLNLESGSLFAAPMLLLLVPAVNAVGGNVGSILGARISSGLHLGSIEPSVRSSRMWANVAWSLVAGLATFAFLAAVAAGVAPLLGIDPQLGFAEIMLLLVATGLLLVASLSAVAVVTAFVAFRQGLDPDNAVIPVVTTVGDLLGIVWLIVVYGVIT